MQILPIKTRVLQPPQDDLFAVLDESLPTIKDGDVLAVSSKVVAIAEGNCISAEEADKRAIVEQEADALIPRDDYWPTPLTIKHNAFISAAGVDASNANGHYVLLPKEPFSSAATIRNYLKQKFNLTNIGVVITDSHSMPLRRGAMGISIGYAGINPLKSLVGEKDLFGRSFKVEVANVVDAVAAAATLVMGEGSESQPLVILRDVPELSFIDTTDSGEHFVPPAEDIFRVLYRDYLN